jgi:hypothetical protein
MDNKTPRTIITSIAILAFGIMFSISDTFTMPTSITK